MRYQLTRNRWSIFCLVLVAMLTGCGSRDADPARATVTGRLTLAGKPLAGAHVHFVNLVYPDRGTSAVTDADGRFELSLGAIVGLNKVYFSKFEGGRVALNPDAGIDAGQMQAMAAAGQQFRKKADVPRQVIPLEYSTSNSKLKILVPPEGVAEAKFDL